MKRLFHILFDTVWGPVALWALAATIFVATVTIDLFDFEFHPLAILLPFVLFVLPATVIAISAFVRSIVLRHWGRAILQLGWGVTAFGYACLAMIFTLFWIADIKYPMPSAPLHHSPSNPPPSSFPSQSSSSSPSRILDSQPTAP